MGGAEFRVWGAGCRLNPGNRVETREESIIVKAIKRIVSTMVVQIKSGKRENGTSFWDNLYRKRSMSLSWYIFSPALQKSERRDTAKGPHNGDTKTAEGAHRGDSKGLNCLARPHLIRCTPESLVRLQITHLFKTICKSIHRRLNPKSMQNIHTWPQFFSDISLHRALSMQLYSSKG